MGVGGSDGIPRDPKESINLVEGGELPSYPFVASTPKLTNLDMGGEGPPMLPFGCIHPKTQGIDKPGRGEERTPILPFGCIHQNSGNR